MSVIAQLLVNVGVNRGHMVVVALDARTIVAARGAIFENHVDVKCEFEDEKLTASMKMGDKAACVRTGAPVEAASDRKQID